MSEATDGAASGTGARSFSTGYDPGGAVNVVATSPGQVTSPEAPTATGSPILTVVAVSTAVGETGTSTISFRISGNPVPGTSLVVHYTLVAHDATGTFSTTGTARLTGETRQVTIPTISVVAGRSLEVVTIQIRSRAGVRVVRASATRFLPTPARPVSDTALFEAHRLSRSQPAFELLVQRHGPAVTRQCQRLLGNRADAEDVAQFVFLTLARQKGRFSGTLTGWLRSVARNASLAFLRAKWRRYRHEREAAKPVAVSPDAADGFDERLRAALRQLPADLEQAVRLRFIDGYTQREAARIAGCPRGTLSRRASEGIRLLRESLESDRLFLD